MSSSVRNPVPLVAHKCEVQAASSDVRLLKHTGRHLFERSSSDSDPSGRWRVARAAYGSQPDGHPEFWLWKWLVVPFLRSYAY